MEFEKHKENCPAHDEGFCRWQPFYNQHINDLRYCDCEESQCPIFYWVEVLSDKLNGH